MFFFNTKDGNVLSGYFYEYKVIDGQIAPSIRPNCNGTGTCFNDVARFLKRNLDLGALYPNGTFKKMLSEVSLLINFYTPQERMNISIKPLFMREFVSDNFTLMLESMKFFDERLMFWYDQVKQYNK